MASDTRTLPKLKLQDEKRANEGKFRVLVVVDSEAYQLGEDQDTLDLAMSLFYKYGKVIPYQIFNSQGEPQINN